MNWTEFPGGPQLLEALNVGDLDFGQAAAAHADADAHRSGVQRVLDEFFDDRDGALDHFAGRDLPDCDRVEEANRHRGAFRAPAPRFRVGKIV